MSVVFISYPCFLNAWIYGYPWPSHVIQRRADLVFEWMLRLVILQPILPV